MAKIWIGLFLCTIISTRVLSTNDFLKSIHVSEELREKYAYGSGKTFILTAKEQYNARKNVPGFVQGALSDLHKTRSKRAATDPGGTDHEPTSTQFPFNDSHSQMVVHWAGKDSNVIIALTKGIEIGSDYSHRVDSSHVYVSRNYGETFSSIDNNLRLPNGSQAVISQFINCPSLNSHYMFTDEHSNSIFTTQDYGRTVSSVLVPFKPTKLMFHKTKCSYVLGMNYNPTGSSDLYLTKDFGVTWDLLKTGVRTFHWEDDAYGLNSSCIYIHRISSDGVGSIVRSCDFFRYNLTTLLLNVHDFEVQGPYMFATRRTRLLGGTGFVHQIFISHYRKRFINSEFPHALTNLDYYIADASEDQIFMCVGHDGSRTHLYISETNSTKFSLSLEDILYFNPNGSLGHTWLQFYTDKPFADLHKVQGIRGVYIATQLINGTLGTDHQRTLISFDKGGEWQLVVAPERNLYNQISNCTVQKDAYTLTERNNCSLHLTQTFDHLTVASRTASILSKESAPGIIVATGNTGARIHIDETAGIYLSADAGYTWHQVLQGVHLFALADHGGVILGVRAVVPTNQIVYSTDEGETWKTYNFTTSPIRIHGILTEPGERTTVFFLFGSAPEHHSWRVISLDTRSVFEYECTAADYKDWSLPDDTPFHGCLLGRKVIIERRIPRTNCYNGKDYTRKFTSRNCPCTREDFECDYGYKPSQAFFSAVCVPEEGMNVHMVPNPCPAGTYYPVSRGYAKISGDTCSRGSEHQYSPIMYACRVNEIEQFMLWTSGEVIYRYLFSSRSDTSLVNSDSAKNVTALDYEYTEQGCLYWADNQLHKIQKLCEDGNSTIEVLHYMKLGEVVSIAYDWQGLNIYWLDRQYKTIEVSKRDGRHRRQLINSSFITEPNSLAIDPYHGWMYWTDQTKIRRAWMDGTHSSIQTILTDEILGWTSGLVIDYVTEKIYYSGFGIKSANLDGTDISSVVLGGGDIWGIRSLGIYKNQIYWSDSFTNQINYCNKAGCSTGDIQSMYKTSSVDELKIFAEHSQQGGNEACKNNGGCTQLCLLKPPTTELHGKNRTCRCGENGTLSVIAIGGDEDEQCCPAGGLSNNGTAKCVISNSTCSENQFLCHNGRCISALWTCDRDNDCHDNSDELDCPFMTCSDSHFTCDNGNCIPQNWKCDFDNDCLDNSDERNCTYPTCSADKFTCTDGRCINKRWQCDFDDDCPDASDERNCTTNGTVCEENEFVCASGTPHCILNEYVCDGHNHCSDRSDERNCTNVVCPSWKRACGNNGSECVYTSWICDGDRDCSNGFDEANCNVTTARPSSTMPTSSTTPCGFRCNNGICITPTFRCDGLDDCGDNSDERYCGHTRNCSSYQFTCLNGECRSMWQRCNGHPDCGDGSDEYDCGFTTVMPTCGMGQFLCYNSSSRRCISLAAVCDDYTDCEHGEDEQNCGSGNTCDQTLFFKCRQTQGCIPRKFVCNEALDCPDGSDEEHCSNRTELTPSNITCHDSHHMACHYEDKCLPYIFVCDGRSECAHSSDENLKQCFDRRPDDIVINAKTGQTNISLYWTATPGNNVAYIVSVLYYHQYHDVYHNHTAVTRTTYNLTKLLPATMYYVTLYANVSGSLQKYEVRKLKTLDDVPDAPTFVTLSSDSKSDEIDVSWYSPTVNKGKILHYEVCIGTTPAPRNDCVPVDGDKALRTSFDGIHGTPFEKGKVYYVQVSATTSAGEGPKSDVKNVTFGIDGISSYVGDLQIVPVGNNSLNISWSKPNIDKEKIDQFRIQYHDLFDNLTTVYVKEKNTSLLVTNLCSGTVYMFSVTACSKKLGCGIPLSTTAQTNGTKLNPPTSVKADLISPTTARITWDLPKGATEKENFTVFYHYIPGNMYSHLMWTKAKRQVATTNSTQIGNLRACELYFFSVAVTGSGHCRPSHFATINTSPDEQAPPEDLVFDRVNSTAGKLYWESSCFDPVATGYIVFRTELATGKELQTQPYTKTNLTHLSLFYKKLIRGATYNFTVKNTNKGSRMSEPLIVKIDPYQEPFNIHVRPSSLNGDSGTLVWNAPLEKIPKDKFKGYEVVLCSRSVSEPKKCSDISEYKNFNYTKATKLDYKNLKSGFIHCFKVRLNKIDGYYGNASVVFEIPVEAIPSPPTTSSPFIELNKTNVIAIAVSVAVVVIALVVVIGCFVVRHKRLQRSFRAYASSHYDSSTGTTTFSAADELGENDEEDAPMIRGFSDDEPLVIA